MKNILFLALAIFLLSSCTKEIYRGSVAHVDGNDKLIHIYGMNKAIWSDESEIILNDFVKVSTHNNFKTNSVDKVCTPILGHCHLDGDGLHNRIHIRDIGGKNFTYNDKEYKSAKIWEIDEAEGEDLDLLSYDELDARRAERFDVWVEDDFDFKNSNIYILRLQNKEEDFITLDGRQLIVKFTVEKHPGHTR